MTERNQLPEAFTRVHARVQIDKELRFERGSNISPQEFEKRVAADRPVYGGYLDERNATDLEIVNYRDAIDTIVNNVSKRGSLLDEDAGLRDALVDEDDIDHESARFIPTTLYSVVACKEVQSIGDIVYLFQNEQEAEVGMFAKFTPSRYILDIEFESSYGGVDHYYVSRTIEDMRKDDFDIAMFMLAKIHAEL